ncbi:hypothetical protein LGR54_04955 [Ancylobacter sp. Lp-2]|uniref:hypothetical protein n=1 Tax=Ancylobacter sp. Lp-2 TaxID=2881339 RepID=UPI001E2FEC85|nr:hypothetical protein [Ancylobacter sp. Lp-2]MCB4767946.1 hypothetical protein [Ancylobacter sp. Lp-2]
MRPVPERPASRLLECTAILFSSLVLTSLALVPAAHANMVQPMGDKARSPAAQTAFKKCMSTELKARGGSQAVSGDVHARSRSSATPPPANDADG